MPQMLTERIAGGLAWLTFGLHGSEVAATVYLAVRLEILLDFLGVILLTRSARCLSHTEYAKDDQ